MLGSSPILGGARGTQGVNASSSQTGPWAHTSCSSVVPHMGLDSVVQSCQLTGKGIGDHASGNACQPLVAVGVKGWCVQGI